VKDNIDPGWSRWTCCRGDVPFAPTKRSSATGSAFVRVTTTDTYASGFGAESVSRTARPSRARLASAVWHYSLPCRQRPSFADRRRDSLRMAVVQELTASRWRGHCRRDGERVDDIHPAGRLCHRSAGGCVAGMGVVTPPLEVKPCPRPSSANHFHAAARRNLSSRPLDHSHPAFVS
jgi:hypothetical protein